MRSVIFILWVGFALLSGVANAQARRPMPRPGPIERLNRMTPEQRQRALNRLPADRRARVEQRLERLNAMPPAARERLSHEYEEFQKLPPEKQQAVRKAFRDLNHLPEDRRPVIRREAMRLRNATLEDRAKRLDSEEFRHDFNEDEQRVIRDLSEN